MRIHVWQSSAEPSECLLTPEESHTAPPPSSGGEWVHREVVTHNEKSFDHMLFGSLAIEEVRAVFSFAGYWTGSLNLE